VGRRRRKRWLWLAVERASRRRVAWVLGSRGTATLTRLWQALPKRYHRHTRSFTDAWRAYPQMLPAAAHGIGKTGTRVVEALNGKLRHRCGVLVRRFRSFSKCRISHYNRSKIAIDPHNFEITLD
jgi:IS1 family transposase